MTRCRSLCVMAPAVAIVVWLALVAVLMVYP